MRKKKAPDSTLESDGLSLKKVLHEPLAPYFASTYTTLVSIVQGFALSALVFTVFQNAFTTAAFIKGTIGWLLIALVWHRYVGHIQYVAWRLAMFDTIIPMGFAVIQFWVIFSIPRSTFEFSLAMTFAPIWGLLAYFNSYLRYMNPHSPLLFDEHFKEQGKEFSRRLFWEISEYQIVGLISMIIVSVLFGLISGIIYSLRDLSENTKAYIACPVFGIVLLVLLFSLDLKWKLSRSEEEAIRKYGW